MLKNRKLRWIGFFFQMTTMFKNCWVTTFWYNKTSLKAKYSIKADLNGVFILFYRNNDYCFIVFLWLVLSNAPSLICLLRRYHYHCLFPPLLLYRKEMEEVFSLDITSLRAELAKLRKFSDTLTSRELENQRRVKAIDHEICCLEKATKLMVSQPNLYVISTSCVGCLLMSYMSLFSM